MGLWDPLMIWCYIRPALKDNYHVTGVNWPEMRGIPASQAPAPSGRGRRFHAMT